MKKFILVFGLFIYLSLSMSFVSYAQYLPPVDPVTTQIPSFLETVAQTQIASDTGVYSPFKGDLNSINQMVNGRTIEASMSEVYVDNDGLITTTFYDSNGNVILSSDTYTAFGVSDVGQYTYVADKNTGEIVGISYNGTDVVSTLQAGNLRGQFPEIVLTGLSMNQAVMNAEAFRQAYADASNRESLAVYDSNDLSTTEIEFINSNDFHMYAHSNTMGWTVYVPNTCTSSTLVSDLSGRYSYSGYVDPNNFLGCPNIFTNDPTSITFSGGNTGNYGYLKYEPNSYYGQNFQYVSAWFQTYNPLGFPTGGYLDFRAPTQSEFQTYNSVSNKARYVRPVNVEGDTIQNYYNYTYVTENPPEYVTNINNNYDYTDPTTPDNYPFNTSITIPNYQTENNYLTNIYNYYTTPQIGGDVGSVNPEDVTNGIPILNNLRYRFPFSIPFDIYNLVSGLSVQREAPSFDWDIYFPVIDYTWSVEFDLSAWDSQASIFRTCFLILFIIALAMWSYNHFFGN